PGNVGLTVVAQEVFDLVELAADRAAGHSLAACLGRQRRKQAVAGLAPTRTAPEPSGDPIPARQGPAAPPRVAGRPWHSSGGSAGR
ncbi:MAG TPA: hypothetical protein VE975_08775, partial [Actinomycetota bacterium]|nr:hypothetical protein [Actinomycetota bacterium]